MSEREEWIQYEAEKRKIYDEHGFTPEADQKIKELLKELKL